MSMCKWKQHSNPDRLMQSLLHREQTGILQLEFNLVSFKTWKLPACQPSKYLTAVPSYKAVRSLLDLHESALEKFSCKE